MGAGDKLESRKREVVNDSSAVEDETPFLLDRTRSAKAGRVVTIWPVGSML